MAKKTTTVPIAISETARWTGEFEAFNDMTRGIRFDSPQDRVTAYEQLRELANVVLYGDRPDPVRVAMMERLQMRLQAVEDFITDNGCHTVRIAGGDDVDDD